MTNFSRYDVDARSMMEDLYIGPQAEVLELIDVFNNDYVRRRTGTEDLSIGITNKFRWKPGTYDKVKSLLHAHWFGWNRRPSGMDSLFYRMNNYTKERMRDKLNDIERKLYNLRSDGRSFLEDLDQVTEIFNLFRNKIGEASEVLQEIHPDMSLYIEDDGAFRTHKLVLQVPINNINIKVTSGSFNEDGVLLGEVPYGSAIITFKTLLHKWFNRSYKYLEKDNFPDTFMPDHRNIVTVTANPLPKYIGALHPYINRGSGGFSNICMGELHRDIISSFSKYEWNALAVLLDQWLSNYKVGVTGPLNGIQYSFIGKPKLFNDEFFDVVAPQHAQGCFDNQSQQLYPDGSGTSDAYEMIIQQCDATECQLRENCTNYQRYAVLYVKLEELRDKITMDWAFDTLFPAQQMKEPFVNWLTWKIRDCYDYDDEGDIEPFWTVIYNAIENCQWPIVLKVLEDLVTYGLVKVNLGENCIDDINWLHSITKCKTQEALVKLIMPQFEESIKIESDQADLLTDEQEQMIMWAQSQGPR